MSSWRGGRVVLLSKQSRFCRAAREIAEEAFGRSLDIYSGATGDPLPDLMSGDAPAWLISFLSPWIVPAGALDRAGCAINFHPGSADYPGTGCYNFALYEGAREYGAVCHVMYEKVDTGPIIEERLFRVLPDDSVETLKLRTLETMLIMFADIVGRIAAGRPLPSSERHWTRPPFLLREMNALRSIRRDMPEEEAERRVRAMTYPGYPGAERELPDGSFFRYPVPRRSPLA
jgi:methionyl-tRNA formyltransferase